MRLFSANAQRTGALAQKGNKNILPTRKMHKILKTMQSTDRHTDCTF